LPAPALTDNDRSLLGAIAAALPRRLRDGWIVAPETLLRWHRQRIAKHWTQPPARHHGRPPTSAELRQLIVRLAKQNPTWGHQRIQGELARIGHTIAKTTVWQILTSNGIEPSPNHSEVTWSEFLHSQATVACDFFTADTACLHRYYVLFFIKIDTREVFYAGTTANPPAPGRPKQPRTCSRATTANSTLSGHRSAIAAANSSTRSTRYSEPRASRPSAPQRGRRSPTHSPNDGLDRSDKSSSSNPQGCPAPPSGTTANSNASSSTTSSTTTSIGLTSPSDSTHRHRTTVRPRRHQRPSPCSEPVNATASSMNTETPPDQPRPTFQAAQPETPPATVTVLRRPRCDGLIHEYRNAA
jgi:hypothetical protein